MVDETVVLDEVLCSEYMVLVERGRECVDKRSQFGFMKLEEEIERVE